MLKGNCVNLRKVEGKDLEMIKSWLESSDFRIALHGSLLSGEAQARIATMLEENCKLNGELQYFVIENKKALPIGLVTFAFINWRDRSLALEIFINENGKRGALYGAEALLLACLYSFHHLNMHRIAMFINEFNHNALGIASKTCVYEGKLRNQVFHEGRLWDSHAFGLLKNEFTKKIVPKAMKLRFDYVKTNKYY